MLSLAHTCEADDATNQLCLKLKKINYLIFLAPYTVTDSLSPPHQTSHVEALIPNVTVLRGKAFGR